MRLIAMLCLSLCLAWVQPLPAAERWRVAVAEVPGLAEANGTGPLLDLVRALDEQMPDIDFELQITPFARTFNLLQNAQCEFQVPFLGNLPRLPGGLRYGSGTLWQVRFGLFTRRANALSVAQLLDPSHVLTAERLAASGLGVAQQAQLKPLLGRSWRLDELQEQLAAPTVDPALRSLAYPYRVETDRAHAPWLGFPALSGNSIEGSLQKLVRGRIDGYVFAVLETEHEVDRLGLRDQLRVQDFGLYPVRWLVADNPRGKWVDQRLAEALRKLQAQPAFRRLQAPLKAPTDDWRPWPWP